MKVYLNNKEIVIQDNETLGTLLSTKGIAETTGIAVAINSTVISKDKWETTTLKNEDKLMLITATAGG